MHLGLAQNRWNIKRIILVKAWKGNKMARNISKESLEQKIAKKRKQSARIVNSMIGWQRNWRNCIKSRRRYKVRNYWKQLKEAVAVMRKSWILSKWKSKIQMNNSKRKTKPELRKQIEELERRLRFMEKFLDTKGLFEKAEAYVEKSVQDMKDLPFD